jgi:NitT/TauT family transport system substrate-binding protein
MYMNLRLAPELLLRGGVSRLAFVLLLLFVASVGGCRRHASGSVVRLGYFANLSHAQALLAVDSGELARALAPARVETRIFNAGPALVEALLAGEIDMGYVGPGPAIAAHERTRGKGIRIVAGASADGVVVVANATKPELSMTSLPSVRVATPQLGNTQDIAARHYVKMLSGDTHRIVPVPTSEQAAMFVRGQVDAAWVPEPWGERLITETGARLVAEERTLWPSGHFALALVVADADFLREHRDLVARTLRVHRSWTERLQREPDRHVDALAQALHKATGKRLADGILRRAMTRVTFTDDPYEDSLSTMSQWARDLGFARRQPDLSGLVDTSVLDEGSQARLAP